MDPTTPPTVSIGMPVYNGARYLVESIDSVLGQTYRDLELVISDNASDDSTEEICRDYAAADSRVRYSRQERNRGAAENYNRVFTHARGRYFKWQAHDDVCASTFLERCVAELEVAPEPTALVYPRAHFIDGEGRTIGPDHDSLATESRSATVRAVRTLSGLNRANPVFGLIRSDVLRKTRLIDKFIASDFVLLFELALLGGVREVPEVLLYRRLHAGSSREANRTVAQVTAWFAADAEVPRGSVRSLLLREYLRSVHALPIATPDRILLSALVPATDAVRRSRVRAGRTRQEFVRFLASGSRTRAADGSP